MVFIVTFSGVYYCAHFTLSMSGSVSHLVPLLEFNLLSEGEFYTSERNDGHEDRFYGADDGGRARDVFKRARIKVASCFI